MARHRQPARKGVVEIMPSRPHRLERTFRSPLACLPLRVPPEQMHLFLPFISRSLSDFLRGKGVFFGSTLRQDGQFSGTVCLVPVKRTYGLRRHRTSRHG
jgi:hypothetical protein